MSAKPMPARLVPPGRTLRRELDARGWTQRDLAAILGRPAQTISSIVKGAKQITPETAVELGKAFGTSPDLWMNLESNYRVRLAQQQRKSDSIVVRSQLYDALPVREIVKRGWIRGTKDSQVLKERVLAFLRIRNLASIPNVAASFRGAMHSAVKASHCLAWIRRAEALARRQKAKPFSRARFADEGIARLQELTASPDDVRLVRDRLRDYGVRFVIVPHLERTYLDGAAFYLSGTPVVAVTLRYDRIDGFWFALMHEVAHVAMGHKGCYLDSRDGDLAARQEADANRIAQEWLVPSREFQRFVQASRGRFSKARVYDFALATRRHPGIIVGRLHWEDRLPYSHLRGLLAKVRPHLEADIDN